MPKASMVSCGLFVFIPGYYLDPCHFAGVPVEEAFVALAGVLPWCRSTVLLSFLAAYLTCHSSCGLLPP